MQYCRHSISVGISLPRHIVSKIDAKRGDVPRSRYILRILKQNEPEEESGNAISSTHKSWGSIHEETPGVD